MTCNARNQGFTLIEIIIVMAILTFIISFGLVMNLSYFKSDIFAAEQSTLVSALQKARGKATSNTYETVHGVCYISPNYVIFRGRNTCLPANAADETLSADSNIAALSAFSATFPTIVFSQLAGTTTATTITLTDGIKSATISVNAEGTINW